GRSGPHARRPPAPPARCWRKGCAGSGAASPSGGSGRAPFSTGTGSRASGANPGVGTRARGPTPDPLWISAPAGWPGALGAASACRLRLLTDGLELDVDLDVVAEHVAAL